MIIKKSVLVKILILMVIFLANPIFSQESNEPNDSLFYKQKKIFDKLNVLKAWSYTKGSSEILIGVIDCGFDFFHPDLKDQLIPGYYAPNLYHSEIYDIIGHGTFVSSIIVAKDNNKIGITGMAPDCKVLTASLGLPEHVLLKLRNKFFEVNPNADMSAFQIEMANHEKELNEWAKRWGEFVPLSTANSIIYLVDQGVKVINISAYLDLGLLESCGISNDIINKLHNAFEYAYQNDVIIVIGAGNNANEVVNYPGNDNYTIVVGATLLNDERWEKEVDYKGNIIKQGSNYGNRLTVMASVESLAVCIPHDIRFYASKDGPTGEINEDFEGMYDILSCGGTSSATAIVTSLVALVRSARIDLNAKTVIEIIKRGCDDLGDEGYDIYTGYGRINFLKTLRLAKDYN